MPKHVSSLELTLNKRPQNTTVTRWLLDEIRRGVLEGRFLPGTRLPATRDFARQYGVSRGTVVSVFEQLQIDGYLHSRVGAGTWVNEHLPQHLPGGRTVRAAPASRPKPREGLVFPSPARPSTNFRRIFGRG